MEKRRDKSGDFKTLDHPFPRSPVSLPDAGGKRPGVGDTLTSKVESCTKCGAATEGEEPREYLGEVL